MIRAIAVPALFAALLAATDAPSRAAVGDGNASGPPEATAPATLPVAAFSALPPGETPAAPWRLQTYAKVPLHTRFTLVEDAGVTVLQVRAEQSAASLIRPFVGDPAAMPLLRWRWKPLAAPQRSALGDKAADDWGARLYVLFEPRPETVGFGERLALGIARALYGDELPARGICYVWLPGGRVGATAANAYTDRLQMIVVDSSPPGAWRSIERNLADDYRAAFGEPLAPVSALAVSADSDNGGGVAEVLVGDIAIGSEPRSIGSGTEMPAR